MHSMNAPCGNYDRNSFATTADVDNDLMAQFLLANRSIREG